MSAVSGNSITPTTTTPWMALAPDISGVCSVAGTLLITSKPTSRLSTKTVMSANEQTVLRSSAARTPVVRASGVRGTVSTQQGLDGG